MTVFCVLCGRVVERRDCVLVFILDRNEHPVDMLEFHFRCWQRFAAPLLN